MSWREWRQVSRPGSGRWRAEAVALFTLISGFDSLRLGPINPIGYWSGLTASLSSTSNDAPTLHRTSGTPPTTRRLKWNDSNGSSQNPKEKENLDNSICAHNQMESSKWRDQSSSNQIKTEYGRVILCRQMSILDVTHLSCQSSLEPSKHSEICFVIVWIWWSTQKSG